MENLSQKLLEYRLQHSLSQRECAKMIGISVPTLLAIENNKYNIAPKTINKIMNFLNEGETKKMKVIENEYDNYKSLMDDLANLLFDNEIKNIRYDFTVNTNDNATTILEGTATPQKLLFLIMKRLPNYESASITMECNIPLLFAQKNNDKYILSYCQ